MLVHSKQVTSRKLKMTCSCVSIRVAKIIVWIALILLVFSVVLIIMFPTIYNAVLKKEISLGEGSLVTNVWKDIPLTIYEKLYFFNITNKEQFLDGSEPLNVTEVGPYTYSGKWVKNNPFWNSNNTVSYREIRTYHFVPDMTNGTEEDEIYTLNGPLIIASSIAKDYGEDVRALLSILLSVEGEHVVIKRKIKELVYDGYEDFIIKYARLIKSDIPYDKGVFSWLYGKNATDDGLFTVFTGVDDLSKTNILNNWNGEEELTYWKGDTCNMLNGTSVETGPPVQDHQESYTFFQTIFCRSITLNYTEDAEHYGIATKRFRPNYSTFANSTENPENYCFEVDRERPSGILDVSPCQFGSPVFISFPHFHLADPSYLNAVSGLSPNDKEHGSYLDVELLTGLSVSMILRFQINIELSKVTGIFQTYKPSKGILPVLWAEINVQITEDLADFLKSKTRNPKIISYSVLGVLMVVSLIFAVVGFFILCSQKSDEDDPLLNAVTEDYSPYYNQNHVSTENDVKENEKNVQEKSNGSSEYRNNFSDKSTEHPEKK